VGREALSELAGRYERSLLGLACAILDGREDLAMDAVQETWVRVIRFAGGFGGRSGVKTWLYRIAINQCRTLRWTLADGNQEFAPESEGRIERESGREDRNGLNPPAVVERSESMRDLHRAVARLGDAKRELVLMCYHGEMTHADAAAVLEIPVGTLKSRLHSALTQLRGALAVGEGAEGRA
jgi:RNA polymerase sigma-70 factor (ECF subfamily)